MSGGTNDSNEWCKVTVGMQVVQIRGIQAS
jgi:hypothetical protein